jgi:hypothetical protein
MPMSAGDLAGELRTNLDTLKWCLEMTAHIHEAPFHDRLVDNSRLSHPEIDAVRAEFGHLTGSQIEAEFADRQGHLDKAHDELSRLISTTEAAERCGVSESTIRGGCTARSSRLSNTASCLQAGPGMAFFRQIDVHLANEASRAKAAAVARQPLQLYTDRNEALNQLTAAVAACIKAGLTDIPVLVQQIVDSTEPDQH